MPWLLASFNVSVFWIFFVFAADFIRKIHLTNNLCETLSCAYCCIIIRSFTDSYKKYNLFQSYVNTWVTFFSTNVCSYFVKANIAIGTEKAYGFRTKSSRGMKRSAMVLKKPILLSHLLTGCLLHVLFCIHLIQSMLKMPSSHLE